METKALTTLPTKCLDALVKYTAHTWFICKLKCFQSACTRNSLVFSEKPAMCAFVLFRMNGSQCTQHASFKLPWYLLWNHSTLLTQNQNAVFWKGIFQEFSSFLCHTSDIHIRPNRNEWKPRNKTVFLQNALMPCWNTEHSLETDVNCSVLKVPVPGIH